VILVERAVPQSGAGVCSRPPIKSPRSDPARCQSPVLRLNNATEQTAPKTQPAEADVESTRS